MAQWVEGFEGPSGTGGQAGWFTLPRGENGNQLTLTNTVWLKGGWAAYSSYAQGLIDGGTVLINYPRNSGGQNSRFSYRRSYELFHGGNPVSAPTRGFSPVHSVKLGRMILTGGGGVLQEEGRFTFVGGFPSRSMPINRLSWVNYTGVAIIGGGSNELPFGAQSIFDFRWYCIERLYRLNGPGQDECYFWINGVLIGSRTDATLRPGSNLFDHHWFGGNISDGAGDNNGPDYTSYRVFDELLWNDTGVRVGPLAFVRNVTVTPLPGGNLIAWDPPETNLPQTSAYVHAGVEIRYRTDREPVSPNDGTNPLGGHNLVPAGTNSYFHTSTQPGQTYYYLLLAHDALDGSQGPAYAVATAIGGGGDPGGGEPEPTTYRHAIGARRAGPPAVRRYAPTHVYRRGLWIPTRMVA